MRPQLTSQAYIFFDLLQVSTPQSEAAQTAQQLHGRVVAGHQFCFRLVNLFYLYLHQNYGTAGYDDAVDFMGLYIALLAQNLSKQPPKLPTSVQQSLIEYSQSFYHAADYDLKLREFISQLFVDADVHRAIREQLIKAINTYSELLVWN